MTYLGNESVAGRNCSSFFVSSRNYSSASANYSTASICLDKELGIPLYYNQTDIVMGAENFSVRIIAQNISAESNPGDFVIPQSYLNLSSA